MSSARNDGGNSLHGGPRGFDKQVWRIVGGVGCRRPARVVFRHTSPDGEMGYPGTLEVEAAYTLSRELASNRPHRHHR